MPITTLFFFMVSFTQQDTCRKRHDRLRPAGSRRWGCKLLEHAASGLGGAALRRRQRRALRGGLAGSVGALEARRNVPTGNGREQHEAVGDREHPIADQRSVYGKAERRRRLADEQEAGNAAARSLPPLFVNLRQNRDEQHERAEPTEQLAHHADTSRSLATRTASSLGRMSRPCRRACTHVNSAPRNKI